MSRNYNHYCFPALFDALNNATSATDEAEIKNTDVVDSLNDLRSDLDNLDDGLLCSKSSMLC